jgi:molecular chaperone HscB
MSAFDVLGLEPTFDLDLGLLEQRYRDLQRTLHPDRYVNAPASERRASLSRAMAVNAAYRELRDDLTRGEVLFVRYGGSLAEDAKRTADPTLLMEIMELREELAETRRGDPQRREKLTQTVSGKQTRSFEELRHALAELAAGNRAALDDAGSALHRLRYYRRFLEEAAALDEEATS